VMPVAPVTPSPGLQAGALYTPADVAAAALAWGATCGPAALAAILQRPVLALRPLLGNYPVREYMTPTHMGQALTEAQIPYHVLRAFHETAPTYGLLFLQLTGPWCTPAVPVAAAYRHTHWVGTAWTAKYGTMIYDINAEVQHDQWGGWVAKRVWELRILPAITAAHRRADGGWFVRWACEVTLPTSPIPCHT
jgi:hypothetical protein